MSNNGSKWIRRARRVAIYRRDGFRCVYCEGRSGVLTLDHVRPLDRGGTHASRNLVTACFACNSAKLVRELRAMGPSREAA